MRTRFAAAMARAENISLDTSVIIAALLSPTGGSFYVLLTCGAAYRVQCCDYVVDEVYEVLSRKFAKRPSLKTDFHLLMAVGAVEVTMTPSAIASRRLYDLIERKDAPILVAALKTKGYLLSLDEDFLSDRVRAYVRPRGLTICTPGEFIQQNRL